CLHSVSHWVSSVSSWVASFLAPLRPVPGPSRVAVLPVLVGAVTSTAGPPLVPVSPPHPVLRPTRRHSRWPDLEEGVGRPRPRVRPDTVRPVLAGVIPSGTRETRRPLVVGWGPSGSRRNGLLPAAESSANPCPAVSSWPEPGPAMRELQWTARLPPPRLSGAP